MPRIALRHECVSNDGSDTQVQVLEDGRLVILTADGDEVWIDATDAVDIADAVLANQSSGPVESEVAR